ncbi:hypothetical protein Nepgr_008874 [Nepenthes gracilis]|uniref:Heparanase-like protein 3 n=1 Tax=Nepenthes gracilis TaxID=150966 RepID=A0AAD3XJP9_NEPGR|nr:hypothetical protein Nepgr_008874 [Nepenthes gracilis]
MSVRPALPRNASFHFFLVNVLDGEGFSEAAKGLPLKSGKGKRPGKGGNRYEKRHNNIAAHSSPCFRVKEGDHVIIGQCRPLSKTVRFIVLKVIPGGSSAGVMIIDHPGLSQSNDDFIEASVFINRTDSIAEIDEDFVCATLDWGPPWGANSLLNLDLQNKILQNAVRAFSPLKIRLGGTLQDDVLYEAPGQPQPDLPFAPNGSQPFGRNPGYLTLSRWDELNNFFMETRAMATFGLNALNGRTINSNGIAGGAWNSTNAESLIRYTVNKDYNIIGWELGNELTKNNANRSIWISPDQYARDVGALHTLLEVIYRGLEKKHLLISPGGSFNATWFTPFIDQTTGSLQVISHHVYNLGPGGDAHLLEKMLDPTHLDGEAQVFSALQNIIRDSATSAVAWVSEAGGAYKGGQNLVTNAFIMNFWYLDELGMAASYDTKTYCRQTLIGGNYSLLDSISFVPNPDYYSALLWHRLMGTYVLSTRSYGTEKLRAYAHSSKPPGGVTLLLLNLDGNASVRVTISMERGPKRSRKKGNCGGPKSGVTIDQSPKFGGIIGSVNVREEYHLTAMDGNLHSKTVLLNGKVLNVSSSGDIPPLQPAVVDLRRPVIVAPYSVVFVHFPNKA